jgi:PAS domain S-box-containing protein
VIGCDSEGTIVYWSAAARAAYGYSAGEALGARAATLLHTRFPLPLLEIVEELADVGRWQGRLVHLTKDGRSVAVESRWVARYDSRGGWTGGLAVERSLAPEAAVDTPPTPATEAAEAAAAAAGPAATLTHDLNNALAIIVNYASFVAEAVRQLGAASTEESARPSDAISTRSRSRPSAP